MKKFTFYSYLLLCVVSIYLTACSSQENLLPENAMHAREIGDGGAIIILDDPMALPEFESYTYSASSNTNGCLTVALQLAANQEEIAVVYKPSEESDWNAVLTNAPYNNGVANIHYVLPCLNANTSYDLKVITLQAGESNKITLGATVASCSNCQ